MPYNTTVRNRLGKIAEDITEVERPENEAIGQHPVTVFIDGAHMRCRREYQRRHLDVVVGKIEAGDMCRRFGIAPEVSSLAQA